MTWILWLPHTHVNLYPHTHVNLYPYTHVQVRRSGTWQLI